MRLVRQILAAAPAILFLMLIGFCMSVAGPAAAQEVPTVENGFRPSMRRGPTLTEQVVIGQDGPEASLLFRPTGLLFGPSGRLFIPDSGNHAILVFDRDGTFLKRIGSQGSGPGEFQMPMGVYFSWDGELVVPDPMNQRTSFFSPDGTYLRSRGLGTDGMIIMGGELIRARRGEYIKSGMGGMFVVMVDGGGGGGPPERPEPGLVEIVDESGRVVRSFGEAKTHENMHVAGMINNVSIAWTPAGKIVLGYRYSNEFRVYDAVSGELERMFSRRTAFNPREPAVDLQEERSPDGSEVNVMLRPLADEITLDLTSDGEGRLWALTLLVDSEASEVKEEEGDYEGLMRLEVYSPEGVLLATVPLEQPATVIRFDEEGNLWTLDERYTLTARRYTVSWPGR